MDSLSGHIQRNHSNFSRKLSTANGLSSKNAYDDVFAGLPKRGPSSTFSSRVEDYTEIFCNSRASSIPLLDLSDGDDTNVSADFRNSKPDYSSIFVGFSDEHIGVSYDQLFPAPSAKIRTSPIVVPDQVLDSSISMDQDQSYDAVKQFNMSYNKTNQEVKDERKVTTHVTELRAVPGFTCFIDETVPGDKTQGGKISPPKINDVRQKMDFVATAPVPQKETRGFVRSRNGSSWDGTYSNSKLFANPNANESKLKSQTSKLEKNNSFYKASSKVASGKDDPRTEARDCSASSSDVELDLNSSAAASVAALKNAIEKAQESIRFAKELMEKKDGTEIFSKKSSKSRSKAKRESIVARQRTHTEKQNNKETLENTPVLFRTKDLNAAEKSESETGFFELVNRGKHRRAVSAFELVDQEELPKIETSGEVLVQREATAEEAEVTVVECSESKEDTKIEENGFKVLCDEKKNSDILESTFVVPELGETNEMGSKEADQENCEEEKVEEDEFFETQDWDDGKDEEEVSVAEDGCLELVTNVHKQELPHEQQQQQIFEENSKEDFLIKENGEDVLANRLEEAFHWVENDIRLSEVFDSHINESKQIDENPGEIIETAARQEKEEGKNEEYERTQSEKMVENDGCNRKENEEVDIIVGAREGHKSSERDENGMDIDEEESRSEKTEENEEEVVVDFSKVGDTSTSEILLEEEASHQLERNEFVEASPTESDANVDEKTSIKAPLQEDGMSETFCSTDSDTGESQVEQYTSEVVSDLANNNDVAVDDLRGSEDVVKQEIETIQVEEIRTEKDTEEEEKERARVKEELAKKKERERERMVVERAIREARERAFAEAREKAERANVEKVNAQIRQRFMAEARDKLEKATQKDEAKLKAERAAVERATQEARKRALEKAAALSQKSSASTSQPIPEASRDSSSSHGTNSELYLMSKAKLEKHQRIMQRAAKALEEKNMRDTIALKEQAERNRLSESLDADIRRWSNGKEGNLRALLSTLQYILGTSSGWQPVSLTDIVTTSAVKKAYRKATLYVHPDKLQQRGATIQQKYICEKVFDLLKAAWTKFNAEER